MAYSKILLSSRIFQSEKNPAPAGMQNAREESEANQETSRGQSAHQTVTADTVRTRSLRLELLQTVQSEQLGLIALPNSLNT